VKTTKGTNMRASARGSLLAVGGVAVVAALALTLGPSGGHDAAGGRTASTATPSAEASRGSAQAAVVTQQSAPATVVTEPATPDEVATDAPRATTAGQAQVVVSYSGWEVPDDSAEVSGFVSGVIESTGTCTLTLTRGSQEVTETTPGEADASTTVCHTVRVPRARLAAGTWQAVLSYRSAASSGISAPATIEVPTR
jgi:hypothetical protein